MQVPKPKKFFHRYLPIPRQLVESELATISDAQLRVYLYLLHRTIGFNKISDNPSREEICHGIKRRNGAPVDVGTGLEMSTVKRALKELEEREWITVSRRHNHHNTYAISKFLRVQKLTPKFPAEGPEIDPLEGPLLDPPYIQETIKKEEHPSRLISMPRKRG